MARAPTGYQKAISNRQTSAVDAHVGARIRMRRQMLHMSQQKLGDALGLTFQQVQKYENGGNRISAGRLLELTRILNVPIGYFFEGCPCSDGKAPSKAANDDLSDITRFMASRDGIELIRLFMRLKNPRLRRYLLGLMTVMANERR